MNAQEKLEAMFCPRLDPALVASIYNDMGDFAECIPILSALAKAAIVDDDGDEEDDEPVASTVIRNSTKKQQQQKTGKNKKDNNSNGIGGNATTAASKSKKINKSGSNSRQQPLSQGALETTTSETDTTTGGSHSQVTQYPLNEKILLWTESVAASRQSEFTGEASMSTSTSSQNNRVSSSSGVQYLPSPAPVQPMSAPTGFKGFKASDTQIITHSTLGSTLPVSSSSASSTTGQASATAAPAARLKAVRNPNFNREVTPLEAIESSDDDDEEEINEELTRVDQQPDDAKSLTNSDLASTSTISASAGVPTKKKNRRSGRGKKDRKKREALRAQAALETTATPLFSSSPLPLKSWKKDKRGGDPQDEMGEVAALLDSATRLTSAHSPHDQQAFPHSQEDNNGEEDEGKDECEQEVADSNNSLEKLDSKKREQVAFLSSCFPDKDHSDEFLIKCLQESRWDVESAVELILSHMFLEDEQVETSSSGSNLSSQSRATTDSSWTTASSGSNSNNDHVLMNGTRKTGKKGRQQQRILHGANSNESDALSNALTGQDELLQLPEANDWAAFERQIQILMTTFHTLPRKTIVAAFHANGANLLRTIDALEAKQRADIAQWKRGGGGNPALYREAMEASQQFDTKLAQLIEMFPGHAVGGLKKFLVFNEGNVQEAMNAILAAGFADEDLRKSAVASVPGSGGSHDTEYIPLQVDIRYKNDRNGTPVPASLLTEAPGVGGWSKSSLSQLPSTSNPYPQGVRPFANTLLDHSNAELYNDEDDPLWCRQQAHDMLLQRNELFRKAAKAYQYSKGKGVGVGGIAAYYADEGKKYDAMGKKWHMRAARAVVQQHRLENKDPNLVDLHGLTISEAQTVVREAVTEWFARSTMQANRIAARPLRIVTGVGSHSKDRIARLYPSILSMLQKDGWRIETENGVILVKGVSRLVTTNRK